MGDAVIQPKITSADTAKTRAEKIGGVLLEDFEPTPMAGKPGKAWIVEGHPGVDKYVGRAAALGITYGITKGIQYRLMPNAAPATTTMVFDGISHVSETVPAVKPDLFAVEKNIGSAIRNNPVKSGVAAGAVVVATGFYWYLGQDDSEIKVARNEKDGKLDITAYHDEQGFHFLSNTAQVTSLIFQKSDPRGEPVLQFASAEQAGAIFQSREGLIKAAQESDLTTLEKKQEADPVKITGLLLHTHKVLNSKGKTKDADTILEALNDLAQLKDVKVNKLIADHVKNFSDLNASSALKALRETLPASVEPDKSKKPHTAVNQESITPPPPPAGTTELTDEQKEELRQLEEQNKKK